MTWHIPAEGRVIADVRSLKKWAMPTLLSKSPGPSETEPLGAFKVQIDPVPQTTATQVAVLDGDDQVTHRDGVSRRGWTVREKTPEELEGEVHSRREGMRVERWQFAAACLSERIISPAEAESWAPGNALPARVETALAATLKSPAQLAGARIRALASPTIRRNNPLIDILRVAFSLTEERVDDLFIAAAALD